MEDLYLWMSKFQKILNSYKNSKSSRAEKRNGEDQNRDDKKVSRSAFYTSWIGTWNSKQLDRQVSVCVGREEW